MTSVALIKSGLNAAYFSGLTHILRKSLRGRGTIFCLHHVVPPHIKRGEFSPNAKLEISPEFLGEIIRLVRKRGYETLSLSDAIARLDEPESSHKPFVVFTLDDGYKDNLTHAQSVFNTLNCPFTVFVAPGIVEGSVELWWRGLEKIIAENISIYVEIEGFTHSYKTQSIAEKNKAWDILSSALEAAPELAQRQIIRDLAKRYNIDLQAMCLDTAMTWDEIRRLSKNPLCSIGAHTMNHYAISKLAVEDADVELVNSRVTIAEKLEQSVEHFAFPYGQECAAGPRDFGLAAKAGYVSSVTTRKGVIYDAHKNHLQALPRVMISGRYSKLRYLDAMISGVPGIIINKFKLTNVT